MNLRSRLRSLILPIEAIDYGLPNKGNIIELGCGEGVICQYLARKKSRQLVGIDKNPKRIHKSYRKNLKFIIDDITKINMPKADGYVISDVLHHIDIQNQKNILKNIYFSLKSGGVLVIKEIDSKETVRSRLSRLWDLLIYPKDRIIYWNSDDLVKFLRRLKFRVKTTSASRFFPGSTTLYFCKK